MSSPSNTSTDTTVAEQCRIATADLASLNRVSHRLALVDTTDRLEQVLDKLLPRLLQRIGDNHVQQQLAAAAELQSALEKIHAVLIEMLSHAMKRVRDDTACQIPVAAILNLLLVQKEQAPAVTAADTDAANTDTTLPQSNLAATDPFTLNLALAFLTLGVPRVQDATALLPGLLILRADTAGLAALSSANTRSQAHQLAHLLLRCLVLVTTSAVQNQKVLRTGSTVSSTTTPTPSTDSPPSLSSLSLTSDPLVLARTILVASDAAAAALYDLSLDIVLYTGTAPTSTIPPNGLSQAAHECLRGGNSVTSRDWAAEMATGKNLVQCKLACLDWIAPSRACALLLGNGSTTTTTTDASALSTTVATTEQPPMGLARTVALLVAATGDAAVEVSERATTYLKMHLDSVRGTTAVDTALGDPVTLACGLLSLCLGQTHAESILVSQAAAAATNGTGTTVETRTLWIQSLGRTERPVGTETSQLIFSTKRRPVSDTAAAVILSFCASKILDEHPTLLDNSSLAAVAAFSQLAVQVATKTLRGLTCASGLSTVRAKPFIAAAQLLNSLSIRLAVYYDSNHHQHAVGENSSQDAAAVVQRILAQSLSTACTVLAGASTQRPSTNKHGTTNSAGNVAVRDACYGVICTLARSQFALVPNAYIFTQGKGQAVMNAKLQVSIETASLLFGCAANEEETLRPRSVAALDALLGAYCRVYATPTPPVPVLDQPAPTDSSANPWANAAPVGSMAAGETVADGVTASADGLSRALLPMIWTAAQTYQPKASRVAAARWSSDLLKEVDLGSACHILCFLAGDSDITASSIAREGLGLPKHVTENIPTNSDDAGRLPDFAIFTEAVFSSATALSSSSSLRIRRFWEFSPQGRAAALRFGLLCLSNDIYGGEDHAIAIYLSAMTETLNMFVRESVAGSTAQGRASIDLLDEASTCLLATVSTSQFARRQLWSEQKDAFSIRVIENLCLTAASSRARRHLAGACGRMYEDSDMWDGDALENRSFERWLSASGLGRVVETTARKLADIGKHHLVANQIHGAAFLGAHATRAFRLKAASLPQNSADQIWDKVTAVFSSLGQGLLHSDEIVGNACADALGIAFSFEGIDAPLLDTRLYKGTSTALHELSQALSKFGNGDATDAPRAVKLATAAGAGLGASTSGSGVDTGLGPARVKCADSLFALLSSMSFRKDEEVGLVVGEALASYADAYNPETVVWGASTLEWPEELSESFASHLPPHEHVLYVLLRKIAAASSPHTRTAAAPALLAVVARAAKGVNSNDTYTGRCLVQSLLKHLDEVQQVFLQLLSDPKSKHLSRESCCLGLVACRGLSNASSSINDNAQSERANEDLNQRLLRAFGQTTKFSGSAMMETTAQAAERRASDRADETDAPPDPTLMERFGVEVGGASGMSESALGAYREMAAATVALGRPDILYTLLMLSVSHIIWFTEGSRERYGASSLLGESSIVASRTNNSEMREALRPHIGKLLPRILRACHDPNKRTREQMSSLWTGLTGGGSESRLAITQHLLPAIDALIEDSASKLWRARVGACGALAEIIIGREWDALGGGPPVLNNDDMYGTLVRTAGIRLLLLWRTAMRSLDDVRGAVRDSGETLARAVRGLTIRLCDPSMAAKSSGAKREREEQVKHERDATAAAATSLRWLIRHGLNQACSEAVGIAVSTLVEIVGVVRPKILEPIIPDLLKSLLMAMSGLEPSALNYLQLRTSDQQGLERIRLQLAQSGPLATAVTKCLDFLPSVKLETQKAVIPQLDAALRQAAGFATRAATADAVSTLCATCPQAFRFSGPSNTNPTVRLLRAFYFASERERGQGAKDKMVHAVGNLASLCPGTSVRSLAVRACERYNRSTGNNDDPASRRAAASTLRAIAVRASNQFADGGNGDIWCRRVLPVAFIGRKDPDPKICLLWKEVWDEGGSAANASDTSQSFSSSLEETLLPYLVHECVKALQDVAWSRRIAGANALRDLCEQHILSPAPRSTKTTRTESTASELARARNRAHASRTALHECMRLLIKPRLWTGKSQVLKATVTLASKWLSWDGQVLACPWKPLLVSPGQFGSDLFTGDRWFLSTVVESETSGEAGEDSVADKMEVDKEDDSPINFEECETEVEEDEQIDSADDPAEDDSTQDLTFTGLCRLFIEHALSTRQSMTMSEEFLPYRAAAFHGFRDLLSALPPGVESVMQRMEIYGETSGKLLGVFSSMDSTNDKKEPPVLVAGAINSLAACFWDGIGSIDTSIDNANVLELAATMKSLGGSKQPAWTIREASCLCVAELATKCNTDALRRPNLISTMVDCASFALKDRKFWKVRHAGLKVLGCLTSRVKRGYESSVRVSSKSDSQEKELMLESLLPYKEEMVRLARSSLSDSEAKVTALSSEILANMSWWP